MTPKHRPSSPINHSIQSAITYYLCVAKSVTQLKQAHSFFLKTLPNPRTRHLSTFLLSRFFKFPNGCLGYARHLFDQIPHCDNPFIWTSFIRLHVVHGEFSHSISLYTRMRREGVSTTGFTFSSVLSACARIPALFEGKQVHARVMQSGCYGNKFVQTALVDLYAKCGLVHDAYTVFSGVDDKDVVASTAMIYGYTKKGMMEEALRLFRDMGGHNVVSWSTMVAGYANIGDMVAAKELYDKMPERNNVTWIAMIGGYGKCSDVVGAKRVFDEIPAKDPLCWSAMLACYAQNGHAKEAIEMYKKMREENLRLNDVAIVGTISACSQLQDVKLASMVVDHIKDMSYDRTLYISNSLIHMYSKFGTLDQAWREFDGMSKRDVVTYTALITAFADHGMAKEALYIFSRMQKEGIQPNQITFVGILNACSHRGLLEEGCKHFELMMKTYGIKPMAGHLTCMVDLLGKYGHLEKAYDLIMEHLQVSDAGVWGALLKVCMANGDMKLAEVAAGKLFEHMPEDTGNYVLLANTYASMSKWDDAERVRKMIRERGMRKSLGCSWISGMT